MTEQHDTFDRFDELLAQSLQSDEQPSSDFTARVMAEVRSTPQRKRKSPYLKAAAGLAACIAVVILAIPLLSPKGSSMAPAADCAAPQEANYDAAACDDAGDAAIYEEEAESASKVSQTPEKRKDDAPEEPPANMMMTAPQREPDSNTAVFCPDDRALCDDAAVWLKEQGIEPQEDGFYYLTADTAEALAKAFPELKLPEGEIILDLNA